MNPILNALASLNTKTGKPTWLALGAALGISSTQLEAEVQPILDAIFKPTVNVIQPDPTTKCVLVQNYGHVAVSCTFGPASPSPQPTAVPRLL